MADFSRLPGPNADLWDWQLVAACRGVDSSLFFHPEGERGAARSAREAAAKEVCMRCPVRAECATHALAVREPYGVWGGLTEDEREAMMGRSRHRATPDRDDDERERERERDRERKRYDRYAGTDLDDADTDAADEADAAAMDDDGPHGRHDDYDPYDGDGDLDLEPDRDGQPLRIY